MLKLINQKKSFSKNKKKIKNLTFFKKKKFPKKPWWFPYRARLLVKKNKFYLNWKKNKIFKKYNFFFKKRKKQIYRFKLKNVFNSITIIKNIFKKIYGLKGNKNFNKILNKNFINIFQKLENRLDVIVAKNLNIRNLKQAQHIIKNGLVYLNNKKIYQYTKIIKPLDVIYFERDFLPWEIRNIAFKKKQQRKKRSSNNYVSRYIPLIVNIKQPYHKYAIPTKTIKKKTFKLLTWYYH